MGKNTAGGLRLHGWCVSPFSYKVLLAMGHKGIDDVEWVPAPLLSRRELKRKTGLTQVPVLEVGTEWIGDSTRIIEWLEARYPAPSVYPADAAGRGEARLLEDWADESFVLPAHRAVWCPPGNARALMSRAVDDDPRFATRLGGFVFTRLAPRMFRKMATQRRTLEGVKQLFQDQLDAVESRLAGRPYFFGDEPTVADFAVASQVINLIGMANESDLRARPAFHDMVLRIARALPPRCAVPMSDGAPVRAAA